jgi:hypothetical protein
MGVVQVLGVVLLVLAACMSAAIEVVLTRANRGVRLPVWGKSSEPPLEPTAARVFSGLTVVLGVLGLAALDASFWWGAVVVIAVVALPRILIRESVHLHQRSRSSREGV